MNSLNNHPSAPRAEIAALTWLRGLAALLVVVSHTVRATEVGYSEQGEIGQFLLFNALDMGSLGVALFFVLSGCTLYISNAKLNTSNLGSVVGFYSKRFMRIWPAFAISLICYMIFRMIFQSIYGEPVGVWIEHQFLAESTLSTFISYLLLIFNFTGPIGVYNNAYWSLPVEFQYYLMFPLLLVFMRKSAYFPPVIIGAIMYFLAREGWVPMPSTLVLSLAFTFLAGMMLGHLYLSWSYKINRMVSLAIITFIVTLVSLMENNIIPIEFYRVIPSEWFFYGLSAIALVFFVLYGNCVLPRIVEPIFMYLGKISYSLYLYHNLLIACAVLLLTSYGVHEGWIWMVVVSLFAFPASIAVATASYQWVEVPGIRIGRHLAKQNR